MRITVKYYSNSNSSINNSGLPSAADANKYFYLPALGYYNSGQLYIVGYNGNYWSSSANPQNSHYAYSLTVSSGNAGVGYGYRDAGFGGDGFE